MNPANYKTDLIALVPFKRDSQPTKYSFYTTDDAANNQVEYHTKLFINNHEFHGVSSENQTLLNKGMYKFEDRFKLVVKNSVVYLEALDMREGLNHFLDFVAFNQIDNHDEIIVRYCKLCEGRHTSNNRFDQSMYGFEREGNPQKNLLTNLLRSGALPFIKVTRNQLSNNFFEITKMIDEKTN